MSEILVVVYITSVFACAALALTVVSDKVKADPHSAWAMVFVAMAGFAIFPILNTLLVLGVLVALTQKPSPGRSSPSSACRTRRDRTPQ